jgi:hypothetical protein
MTIQVQLVLTTLDGRGSTHQIHDTIITPDFTSVILSSPPFRTFNHYSCITSLGKTHSAEADTQTLDVVSYQAGSHGRIYHTK